MAKIKKNNIRTVLIILIPLTIFIGVRYLDHRAWQNELTKIKTYNQTLANDLVETQSLLANTTNYFDSQLVKLTEALTASEEDREDLESDLRRERQRNNEFADQIEDISDTITVLDKLSKTDKELLQKYSKVYFLNEHFVPERLAKIDDKWTYEEDREYKLHSKVMPFFEDMVEEAEDDGVELKVTSAYRSFSEQKQLKGNYLVSYGEGANTFSADQGYSEHQLGTTIDFTTPDLGSNTDDFDQTDAYSWLKKNAYKYGFVLSYPPDNQYYVFEPWHWRFVGKKLARALDRADEYFYDWEQRKIDEYLVSIFD